MKYKKEVTPEGMGNLSRLIKSFEKKEVKGIGNTVQDLNYAIRLAEKIQELEDHSGHLRYFQPGTPLSIENYPRHRIFFDATSKFREVLFCSGNRVGKSFAGAYCVACWATGMYPDWWKGRVFTKDIKGVVCANRNVTFKESVQETLLGRIGSFGTGLLPVSKGNAPGILDITTRHGSGGMFETVTVKTDAAKKPSVLVSRTYEQGREAFESIAADVIWEDEESDASIHNECLLRTMTTQGIVLLTFTPLKGMTPLVLEFKETATDLTQGLE